MRAAACASWLGRLAGLGRFQCLQYMAVGAGRTRRAMRLRNAQPYRVAPEQARPGVAHDMTQDARIMQAIA